MTLLFVANSLCVCVCLFLASAGGHFSIVSLFVLSNEPADVSACSSAVEKARKRRRDGAKGEEDEDAIDAVDADDDFSTMDRSLRGRGEPTLMLATCERAGRVVSGAQRAEEGMVARIFRAF